MICRICGEDFELRPGKPGLANVCPACGDNVEARNAKVTQQEADRKARAKTDRVNKRDSDRRRRESAQRESLGLEVVRVLRTNDPN